jgi:hypothetical protein
MSGCGSGEGQANLPLQPTAARGPTAQGARSFGGPRQLSFVFGKGD